MCLNMKIWCWNGVEKVKLSYKETGSYYSEVERNDVCKGIGRNVEKWFETSNYGQRRRKRPLPVEKIKKIVWQMKDENGGKIIYRNDS